MAGPGSAVTTDVGLDLPGLLCAMCSAGFRLLAAGQEREQKRAELRQKCAPLFEAPGHQLSYHEEVRTERSSRDVVKSG